MLERIFRWTCDSCSRQEEVESYGGPKGWMWRYGSEGIENLCRVCSGILLDSDTVYRDEDDKKHLLSRKR